MHIHGIDLFWLGLVVGYVLSAITILPVTIWFTIFKKKKPCGKPRANSLGLYVKAVEQKNQLK